MQSDVLINAVIAVLSGSLTASIAKFYISRSVDQLDGITAKIHDIKNELSGISVRLEHLDTIQQRVLEHESKIAVLQSKIHYKLK